MIWGLCSENETCDAFLSLRWLFCHSVVSDSVTSWTAARQASLSFTLSQGFFKLMSIELVMPSNHLILCRPLLLLPSIFPSIRVFSNESAFQIRWPKYWSFSFSISPSSEYSGLISLRTRAYSLFYSYLLSTSLLASTLRHWFLTSTPELWENTFVSF